MPYKSEFLTILSQRGFIKDCTDIDALDQVAQASEKGSKTLTGYIGFDCTADSLHAGSLVQIMLLYWLAQTGGRPIALMGGGTTKIGDPSDKDQARPILTPEQIEINKTGIRAAFAPFLEFGEARGQAKMLDNASWLDPLNYIEFLREYGSHFTINKMIALESVKRRLDREQPMTFLEFNYMLLQAFDFLQLYERENCVLQMGGSDQWGNIVNSTDLIRRKTSGQAFGLTTPLIAKADGGKMGKTADGAVWLNAEKLSAYHYWQYWRDAADADIGPFLRKFTTLPMAEIEKLEQLQGAEINEAKIILADEATQMLHGKAATAAAKEAAQQAFSQNGSTLLDGLPSLELSKNEWTQEPDITELFVRTGLTKSKGEAKRHIKSGALKIDNEAVQDPFAKLSDLGVDLSSGPVKLSIGKKRHAVVRLGNEA